MKNRTNKILELLTSEKKVEVSQLAEYLGVLQVTIRKDLDALETKGIIKREHGYAVLCSANTERAAKVHFFLHLLSSSLENLPPFCYFT